MKQTKSVPGKKAENDPVKTRLPGAGDMIMVSGGKLTAGSRPDEPGRDHGGELDQKVFSLGSFEIDILPYPNDPHQLPLVGVSWNEAKELCEKQNRRLCTELEWEMACKGVENLKYPYGNEYVSERYIRPGPVGTDGTMGQGRIGEWTLSVWEEVTWEEEMPLERVIRGVVPRVSSASNRRCARRTKAVPEDKIEGVGFRCCRGETNNARIQTEPPRGPWRELTFIEAEKMTDIIRSIPEVSHLHKSPRFFSPDDLRVALIRGSTEPKEFPDFLFTWRPVRWTPQKGLDLWVFAGISETSSFVVVLYKHYKQDRFLHAASLTFLDTPVPLMLVAKKHHREEIWWGFCWGCRESGTIKLNEEGRVVITHKW